MTDSIRQQLIDAIDTRFNAIDTDGGFNSNLGAHVFDWLDRELADSELESLVYRDRTNEIASFTNREYTNKLRLEIVIKTRSADTTPEKLREMIEDVYAAIGTDDTWGGLALDTQPISEEMEVRHEDKITGTAKIVIEIEYQTEKWKY